MTIDERLERLTDRHEALTQTVEILVHTQQDYLGRQEVIHEKNQVWVARVMESIDGLARIAHSHEHRISDLEQGREHS